LPLYGAETFLRLRSFSGFSPGNRSFDIGNTDVRYGQLPASEYCTHLKDKTFITMQISSPEGVENIGGIASVLV
jgi:2-keto-3-deoxy-L-rhamnonate aldolase RhmA